MLLAVCTVATAVFLLMALHGWWVAAGALAGGLPASVFAALALRPELRPVPPWVNLSGGSSATTRLLAVLLGLALATLPIAILSVSASHQFLAASLLFLDTFGAICLVISLLFLADMILLPLAGLSTGLGCAAL